MFNNSDASDVYYKLIATPISELGRYPCYSDLFTSVGDTEVIYQVDDQDYQGDSRLLLLNGNYYGIVIFGWGSCSGCDALEAAREDDDALEVLRLDLWRSIKWGTREEILNYVKTKDWEGEFYGSDDETKIFINKTIEILTV